MDALALEAMIGLLRQTSLAVSHPLPPPAELTSLILSRLEQKKLLMEFASLFRRNAIKEGIPFLLGNATRVPAGSSYRNIFGSGVADTPAFVLVEPAGGREVGACLYYLSDVLDKRALGEYLGELGREPPAPVPGGGGRGRGGPCSLGIRTREVSFAGRNCSFLRGAAEGVSTGI
ncbi:hypothetical protein C3747_208g24 [Trypanosoma cruzi]|uniref:Uncharacterized protein n=1 Tax=Trypanosoma cruzi TaxID=5693 RepID=A0A2V2VY62_TRYCR|nr:hypothetical protein C3747_208g24 [Trypanosoma cruzi]